MPLSHPVLFALELTPTCSNRCPLCGNVFSHQGKPLPAEAWRSILERLAPYAEVIKLTGGEPTLHPEFGALVQMLDELAVPFAVFTNARWTRPAEILDLLVTSSHCTGLLVSLHGHNAPTHDAFTGVPGSFDETCTNLRRAVLAGLNVHTSTVITRSNLGYLEKIPALAQALGAERAVFNRYLGPPLPAIEPDEADLRQAITCLEMMIQETAASSFTVGYGNCIPACFQTTVAGGCWAGIAYCTIDPWGNLRPCSHSPTIAGNILNQPVATVWQNGVMQAWRDLLPAGCSACAGLVTCRGGCRAMVEIRGADPLVKQTLSLERVRRPQVEFYAAGRPVLACKVLSEPFGYALVRGQSIMIVTSEAEVLLGCLDGQTTLAQIEAGFGPCALDFIGSLVVNGLARLE